MGQNLNHFVKTVEKEQGMQVYMKLDASEEEIAKFNQQKIIVTVILLFGYGYMFFNKKLK